MICDDCGRIGFRTYRYNFDISHRKLCKDCLYDYLNAEESNREETSGYTGEITTDLANPYICTEDLIQK